MELELQNTKNRLCKRCHRKLKDNKSKELGFGPICYIKYLNKKKNYLFNMEANNEIITKK